MKVIVLEGGGTERSLIQAALDKVHSQPILAENPQDVVRLIKTGQGRIVIADEAALGMSTPDFVKLLRAPDLPATYILMLILGERDLVDSDDVLNKPFSLSDLGARLQVAERFLSLGDRISRLNQKLQTMALYDEMTGLMNQAAFLRSAHGELERARRGAAPLSVIALELDDYATPGIAETVLLPAADIIREKSRPYDCIGRWGGGEFVIALPGVIADDGRKIAFRILNGIRAEPLTIAGRSRTVTARAAVASTLRVGPSTELEPLIEQARHAIPQAAVDSVDDVPLAHL